MKGAMHLAGGKLSIRTKLAYGATDLGFSMSYTIVTFFFLFFLTDVIGLKPALAGGALLFGKIWDAVIDPSIGIYSDRLRTRWGRRRPFFVAGAVPYGLTFLLLWRLPQLQLFENMPVTGWLAGLFQASLQGTAQIIMAVAVTLVYMLHITASSALSVPYTALAPELTDDYDDRTSLTAYRMAFSIVGGLVSAILPLAIVQAFPAEHIGFGVMGAIFGAFLILTPLFVFFGTREPARPRDGNSDVSFFANVRMCLSNRPFVAAVIMYLATWVAIDVISTTFEYYLKYYLNMADKTSLVLGLIFVTAVLCLPIWVKISEATGKKAAYTLGLSFLSAILLGLMLVPPGHPALVYALAVLAGFGISCGHVMSNAILPDVVDYDELRTGRRREGVYFGLVTFAQQLASSGAIFLVGVALQASGYVPNVAQSARALWTIRMLIGLGPGLMFLIGIVALVFYPITKDRFIAIRHELESRRAGGSMM